MFTGCFGVCTAAAAVAAVERSDVEEGDLADLSWYVHQRPVLRHDSQRRLVAITHVASETTLRQTHIIDNFRNVSELKEIWQLTLGVECMMEPKS